MCILKENRVIELKINREAYNLANGEYINVSVNNLIINKNMHIYNISLE